MKKYILLSLVALLFISFACEKEKVNEISFEVTTADEINYFIWKGLNLYYLWQEGVPNLADNRFSNLEELYTFFKNSDSPESTFNGLLFQPGNVDRFSWIVDDYVELENSFQGINVTTGMEFGLRRYANNSSNVYAYVRYVVPNSSADSEGVKRGMIISKVNGNQLTDSNFRNLLFGENTALTIGLADYNDGNPIDNTTSFSLIKTEVQENPIAAVKIFSEGNKKIGYLMYNQFAGSYDQRLNAIFSSFQSETLDDLIIDLRYNPGGSTASAGYLGTMITGQFSNEVFSRESWNIKVTNASPPEDLINNFPSRIVKTLNNTVIVDETINSLGLQRIYFIVSGSSASASELVINSLDAYIDVKVIGTKTIGKQVGSVTLYDSDNLLKSGNNLSTKHTYAMQPLVLEIQNKNGVNFPNGIIPGNVAGSNIDGINLAENPGNLGVIGEKSDPLLNRTLTYISTGAKGNFKSKDFVKTEEIYDSKLATPASNNMYSELKDF